MPSETLRLRQGVGIMSAGTYSVPVLSDAPGETFRQIWAKCTGAGHVYGLRVNIQASNATPNTHNAGRFELDLTAGSGLPGGGAAIHAALDLSAGAGGISGVAVGVNASMLIGLDSRNLTGKFACLGLQTAIGANNTFGEIMSFIWFNDAGNVKCPYFWDSTGVPNDGDGASGAWETVADAHTGTVIGYYRIQTAAGAGYICVYLDHP